MTIILIFVRKYKQLNALVKASLMLILAGAIGNLIDRLFYNAAFLHSGSSLCGVVDWIDFYGIWGAIFNIADSCIVIAAVLAIAIAIPVSGLIAKNALFIVIVSKSPPTTGTTVSRAICGTKAKLRFDKVAATVEPW